uniref:RRM domain-containing protein n=1 Tax=Gorilla gorilla gorilla TaxID=9595 RepID=A0A2I2YL45_GORGO
MATEHVNGNDTEEPMDTTSAVTHSENFQTLLDAGLSQKVAEKLDEVYVAGLVAHSHLDERAIEALKEFNEDGALAVLQHDLSRVHNKSAFLCGVMKPYRQREKQGTNVADSSKGPDEAKIKALLERAGYTLDVTTGQRKYGGPPPDSVYSGQQTSVGTEIFVGKIPRDLFEKACPIWDLRLMMDPLTGLNRGYVFVTFCTKEAAQEAVKTILILRLRQRHLVSLGNWNEEKILKLFLPSHQIRKGKKKAQRQAAKNQMYDNYYYYGPPYMPPPTRDRGRGGRGGYGYPPDYYGYEDYYDYYGYDYHNYRGGYEDPYYGYEDFQVGARGRGGRGARGAAPSRGRGAAPPRGRAGYSQRGGPGSARGVRGARGGAQQQRGRGQGKGVEASPDLLQ